MSSHNENLSIIHMIALNYENSHFFEGDILFESENQRYSKHNKNSPQGVNRQIPGDGLFHLSECFIPEINLVKIYHNQYQVSKNQ